MSLRLERFRERFRDGKNNDEKERRDNKLGYLMPAFLALFRPTEGLVDIAREHCGNR